MQSKQTHHASYNVNYHFVWLSKYRLPVLVGQIAKRLVELLRQKQWTEREIFEMTVQPDHVHLFCSFLSKLAPYEI